MSSAAGLEVSSENFRPMQTQEISKRYRMVRESDLRDASTPVSGVVVNSDVRSHRAASAGRQSSVSLRVSSNPVPS